MDFSPEFCFICGHIFKYVGKKILCVFIFLFILEKRRLNLQGKTIYASSSVSNVFPNRNQIFSSICFELSNAEYVI